MPIPDGPNAEIPGITLAVRYLPAAGKGGDVARLEQQQAGKHTGCHKSEYGNLTDRCRCNERDVA